MYLIVKVCIANSCVEFIAFHFVFLSNKKVNDASAVFFFSPVKLNENSVHYQSNGSFWLLLSKQICSKVIYFFTEKSCTCLLYTSDAADDWLVV